MVRKDLFLFLENLYKFETNVQTRLTMDTINPFSSLIGIYYKDLFNHYFHCLHEEKFVCHKIESSRFLPRSILIPCLTVLNESTYSRYSKLILQTCINIHIHYLEEYVESI